MLVLSRKFGESVVIEGGIEIMVTKIIGDRVSLGIVAPSNVKVHRKEVWDAIQRENSGNNQSSKGGDGSRTA